MHIQKRMQDQNTSLEIHILHKIKPETILKPLNMEQKEILTYLTDVYSECLGINKTNYSQKQQMFLPTIPLKTSINTT